MLIHTSTHKGTLYGAPVGGERRQVNLTYYSSLSRFTLRHRSFLVPILLALGICALLFVPFRLPAWLARWHALADDLENLGHPLVFAVFGVAIFRILRLRQMPPSPAPALVALLCTAALGGATEFVQSLVGRDGSWTDLLGDMLGCVCGVAWQLARESSVGGSGAGRVTSWRLVALASAAAAAAPLVWTSLAYIERAREAPVIWRADSALLQRFSHWESGRYPGLVIREPPADWRRLRWLIIDVSNLRDTPIVLNVRVHDRWHNDRQADRYNRGFMLAANESATYRIGVEEIRKAPQARSMDMSWIRGISVFVTTPDAIGSVRIRRVAVEP